MAKRKPARPAPSNDFDARRKASSEATQREANMERSGLKPLSVPKGLKKVPDPKRIPDPKAKRTPVEARVRYLTTAPKQKKKSRETLYRQRGDLAKRSPLPFVGGRLETYKPQHSSTVADTTAMNLRRLLSDKRSPADRREAADNLKRQGIVTKDNKIDQKAIANVVANAVREPTKGGAAGAIAGLASPKKKEDSRGAFNIGKNLDDMIGSSVKAAGTVVGGAAKAVDFVSHGAGLVPQLNEAQRKNAGFTFSGGGPISEALKKSATKGLAAGGGVVYEGFDRPVGAIESAVAKGVAEAGGFSPAKRKRILKARGPGAVLAHGRNWKKDVTGGDLTEALGVGRHLGIGADFALDPSMYIALGLAPETGGGSLAGVVAKIRKVAPELLDTPRVAEALKAHAHGGPDAALDAALKAELGKHPLRRGKKAPLAKAKVAQSVKVVDEALANSPKLNVTLNKRRIKNGLRKKEEVRTTHIPVGNDAVSLALRRSVDRTVRPVPRISLATPLGRRTGIGVNLPIIGIDKLPVRALGDKGRNKLYDVAGRKVVAAEKENKRLVTVDLEQRIGAAMRRKNTDLADRLRVQLADHKRNAADYTRDEIRAKGAAVVGKRHAVRLGEFADQINSKQTIHHYRVQADEYGRTTQALFSRAQEDAAKILTGGQKEIARKVQRVQLHLIAKTENLGGHGIISKAIKLAPDEQKYADNLMAIHAAQLEHGKKTGVLKQGQDDYVGMRIWEKLNNPKEIGENVANAIKNRSSTTGFQRHRAVASVTDRASEAELAQSIHALQNPGSITREGARAMAQKLHLTGKHRAVAELLVRRLQRGEDVLWEDLTPTEKSTVTWASKHPDGSGNGFLNDTHGNPIPMFKNPNTDASLEGHVLLDNPEAYKFTNDLTNLPPASRYMADLLSRTKDKQQILDMRAGLHPDQTQLHQDLTNMHDQIDANTPDVPHPDPEKADFKYIGENIYRADLSDGRRYEVTQTAKSGKSWSLDFHANPEDGTLGGAMTLENPKPNAKGNVTYRFASKDEAILAAQSHIDKQAGGAYQVDGVESILDKQGGLWYRGPKNHDDPPIEGMPKRPAYEAGPLDDPFDFTSRIPETRSEGKMVVLDPRVAGYLRSKAQGATAGFNARWQAADRVLGRSAAEFDNRVAVTAEGDEVLQSNLSVIRNGEGQITSYMERGVENPRKWNADELTFPEPTLIPNHDRSYWIDPRDGQEYVRPKEVLPSGLMINEIKDDRLWPTQAVDSMQQEMINAGELDSAGNLDGDFLDAVYQTGLEHGRQKVMSMVRFGVTTPFPAYHVRNLISDLIKSLQSDSGVLFHPVANAKLTAAAFHRGGTLKLNVPGMGKMTVDDFLFTADLFGVRSGHHVAEVAKLLKSGEFTESNVVKHMQNSWFAPGGKSTRLGANREDVARYMTFLQAMRRNGGDAADAAFQMTRHHFNYNDLNKFERRTMRNIFLFYTWYRKNIPLQLMELARRPGFFAGVSHVYRSVEQDQTPLNIGPFSGVVPFQPGKPDYLRNKLQALTVSWKGYALNVGFGAPWGDLQWLSLEGLIDAPTMLSPAYTVPLQQVFQIDPLTHRRYKSYEPGGLATLYEKLLPGENLPKDEHGNPVMPWRLATILRQLPLIGRGTFSLGSTPPSRDPGRLSTLGQVLNPITGLNINVAPRPGSTREAAAAQKDVAGRLVQGLRRQGLEDLSNLPKESDAYIRALKGIQRKLDEDAARHGTSKYLGTTPQSGHYIKKSRKIHKPQGLGGGSQVGGGLGGGGVSLGP